MTMLEGMRRLDSSADRMRLAIPASLVAVVNRQEARAAEASGA
jgi:hypothetical protein